MVKKEEEKTTKKTFPAAKEKAPESKPVFGIGGRTFKVMTDRVSGYKKHLKDK